MSKRRTDLRLLAPRFVSLNGVQEREAVEMLAELLLEVARKGRGVCGGAFGGASPGGIGGGVSLPARSGKARKAA